MKNSFENKNQKIEEEQDPVDTINEKYNLQIVLKNQYNYLDATEKQFNSLGRRQKRIEKPDYDKKISQTESVITELEAKESIADLKIKKFSLDDFDSIGQALADELTKISGEIESLRAQKDKAKSEKEYSGLEQEIEGLQYKFEETKRKIDLINKLKTTT